MTAFVLRTLGRIASGVGTAGARLRDRIAQGRRDREIARLKAHLSWHPADDRHSTPRPRPRR